VTDPARHAAAYRVGEAARTLGISAATLRLWERQGLIRPDRTRGGSRRYGAEHLGLLRRIRYLRRVERLSPTAIARILRRGRGGRSRSNGAAPVPTVGDRLRAERHRARLTLREVAGKTGTSVSFLSAVERGVTGLSVSRLHALVKLYGITVQDLLVRGRPPRRLVRASERPRLPTTDSGVEIEQLAVGALQMEPHRYVVQPGAGSEGAYEHIGEELVFVLRGRIEVWLEEKHHYRMSAGDCLYFPSTLPHRWHNPGPGLAELLWVNTPPTF
jgi:DNA-binding transcriptional MerR regulator/quercetin dioxygenase-like cupin family protein